MQAQSCASASAAAAMLQRAVVGPSIPQVTKVKAWQGALQQRLNRYRCGGVKCGGKVCGGEMCGEGSGVVWRYACRRGGNHNQSTQPCGSMVVCGRQVVAGVRGQTKVNQPNQKVCGSVCKKGKGGKGWWWWCGGKVCKPSIRPKPCVCVCV